MSNIGPIIYSDGEKEIWFHVKAKGESYSYKVKGELEAILKIREEMFGGRRYESTK